MTTSKNVTFGNCMTEISEDEAYSLHELVNLGYDWFWNQNELTVNRKGEVVRSDTPRVRPKTWFNYMNEDERERLTK